MKEDQGSSVKNRIFISYGHDENIALAIRLKEDLIARGHEVWFDADRINTGADWEQYIDDGLSWVAQDPRGRVILIMTPHSVRRPEGFCLNEIARAVMKSIKILPIMLVWCEPPLSICRIQWLDMTDCVPVDQRRAKYEVRFQRLAEALEHDRIEFEGHQSKLFHILKPISFDAEVRLNLDRFVGRAWMFQAIDRWLADGGASRVFWIVGGPGVGKTAISSWLCAHRPEIVAFHFCRHDNVQKRDPRRAVMSIAYQLSTQLPDYEERLRHINLDEVDRLDAKTLFDHLIVQPLSAGYPEPGRKIAILIDALDEATVDGRNEMAGFIAAGFERTPPWLRLIVTSRPHAEVMGPLQAYTPFTIDIADKRNDQDIIEYLTRELGQLKLTAGQDTIRRIAEKSNGLFLYAENIVAELRSGRLSVDRLDEFPRGLGGIYLKFFERQFPDVDEWEEKICPVLEVISAVMEPLSLKDLGKIFRWNAHDERRFKKSLGSLFNFDHGIVPFHKSVIDWLSNEAKDDPYFISPEEGHKRLADHGWNEYSIGVDAMSAYTRAHLPAHLIETRRWQDCRSILTDLSYFESTWRQDEFSVKSWWSQIEQKSTIRIADAYRPIVEKPEACRGQCQGVASLLFGTGHYDEAFTLYEYLIKYYSEKQDFGNLKDCLGKKGIILNHRGQPGEAMKVHQEEERICRQLNDRTGLQNCLANQTSVLLAVGDLDGISKVLHEMDRFHDQGSKRELAKLLHVKALAYHQGGNLADAMKLYKEKERICREIKDFNGLWSSLNNQACIYFDQGNLQESLRLNQELEQMCRKQGNRYSLQYSLINQSDIFSDMGYKDKAIALLMEAEQIERELGHKNGLHRCLGNRANILHDTGALDEAARLHREEDEICRDIGDKNGHHIAIGNLALIYYDRGMLDEAFRLLKEKESIAREVSFPEGIEMAIGGQALILFDQGMLDEAMELSRTEESICREMDVKKDLNICLCNQAGILYARGDRDHAMDIYRESERTFHQIVFQVGLMCCLNNRAVIYYDYGDRAEAGKCLQEAIEIGARIRYKRGLQACLCNRAAILFDSGDTAGSLKLLEDAEAMAREIDLKGGLAISLIDQAIVLTCQGRCGQALAMAKEACDIVEKCGITILSGRMQSIMGWVNKRLSEQAQPAGEPGVPAGHCGNDGNRPGCIMPVIKIFNYGKK